MTAGGGRSEGLTARPDRPWVPRTAAWVTLLLGALDLLGVVSRTWHQRLAHILDFVPGILLSATALTSAVSGLVLIFLADGLARRKHRAWWVAVVLLAATFAVRLPVVLHAPVAASGFAVVTLGLLAFLLVYRAEFYAIADPRSRRQAVLFFVGMFTVATVVGYLMVFARARELAVSQVFGSRLLAVWAGFLGIPTPYDAGDTRDDDLLYFALLGLGIAMAVALLYLLLRSPQGLPTLTADDVARMRVLLDATGDQDSLGYFALRGDKNVVWSPSGKSCIAYGVVGGVMLASGDPLGDPEAWPGAIDVFMAEARRHAWVPAVAGCSEEAARVWLREAHLEAFELGDEAIVEVTDFSLDGRAMRNVRQMVNRTARNGYTARVRRLRDVPDEERAQLRRDADRWRDGDTERGYSMALGRFGDPGDEDCVVVTAEREGEVRALLHFVPWGHEGLSLDLMRRDRAAEPGLNDFLIVRTLEQASGIGVQRLSLNFAVFRSALERGERIGATPVTRSWRWVLLFASRWAQIDSLYRFNAKFRPAWEPRFVLYGNTRDFARVLVAYLRAEGFVSLPGAGRSRRGAAVPEPSAPRSTTPAPEVRGG